MAAVQDVNGQALTLARKHLGLADARNMKGFAFGVPYRFSMHYYLFCYLLASANEEPKREMARLVAVPAEYVQGKSAADNP